LKKNGKKMSELLKKHELVYEPLRNNRFVIKFIGIDIPEFLFRSYKIFNNGSEIIFTAKINEIINYTLNPQDLFKLTDVIVEYLDPTGVVVNGLKFEVKGINFKQVLDYSDDDLKFTLVRIVVKEGSMNKLYNYDITDGNG
jgi:hypothetical protein